MDSDRHRPKSSRFGWLDIAGDGAGLRRGSSQVGEDDALLPYW